MRAPDRTPYPAPDRAQADVKRNHFLALVFCLMLGTAALPHILMRSYTTPSIQASRVSVFWTLFAGLAAAVLVSLLTPTPGRHSDALVDFIRAPE